MNADQARFVSHKTFSAAQLNGRQLALCRAGMPTRCTINVSAPRTEDNQYQVTLEFGLTLKPVSPEDAATAMRSEPLDQATVDLIQAVEAGSPLQRMRFDFAILQDALAASLLKNDQPDATVITQPSLPMTPGIAFDR